MTASNPLLTAPPYAVDRQLKRLGADLRTARLRRNLTIADVANPALDEEGTAPAALATVRRFRQPSPTRGFASRSNLERGAGAVPGHARRRSIQRHFEGRREGDGYDVAARRLRVAIVDGCRLLGGVRVPDHLDAPQARLEPG